MGQVCSGQKGESHKPSALGDVTPEDVAAAMLDAQQSQVGQLQQQQQKLLLQQQQQQNSSASSLTALQQTGPGNVGGAAGLAAAGATTTTTTSTTSPEEKERLKALQLEQQRLDMIVSAAGRGMVSVRSTRGSTGYYDQGFAAALAQHLEQTTSFPRRLPVTLPPPPPTTMTTTTSDDAAATLKKKESDQPSASVAASGGDDGAAGTTPGAKTMAAARGGGGKDRSSLYSRLSRPQWDGIVLGTAGRGLAGCGGENPARYMDNVAESLLDTTLPAKQQLFVGVKPMVENLF
jgi:hypothetical protein